MAIAIFLFLFLFLSLFLHYAFGQTTTTINTTQTTELPTGHSSIPIATVTNGTVIKQVAPAEAITTIVNTIFAIALPAVSGFIIAIVTAVKAFQSNKKLEVRIEKLEMERKSC